MPENKVIGLLNPKILEDRSGKGEISLSVDHPDKIMEMGDSIDCGKCQAKKCSQLFGLEIRHALSKRFPRVPQLKNLGIYMFITFY